MQNKQIINMCILNISIIIVNVIVFSKGLLGFSVLDENTLTATLSITVILMSIIIFFYGNYKILNHKGKKVTYTMEELDEPNEFIEALESYRYKEALRVEINTSVEQIQRLLRKIDTLQNLLFQKYVEELDDFNGLKQVVSDTESLFYENVKKILNRISIFDQQEYERMSMDNEVINDSHVCDDHIRYIKKKISVNEAILLEFEHLLIEISEVGENSDMDNNLDNLTQTITTMKNLRLGSSEIEDLTKKYDY